MVRTNVRTPRSTVDRVEVDIMVLFKGDAYKGPQRRNPELIDGSNSAPNVEGFNSFSRSVLEAKIAAGIQLTEEEQTFMDRFLLG